MSKTDYEKVEGFKTKMINKIYDGIKTKLENASLLKIMAASNLLGRGIGERKIKPIITAYPNIIDNEKRYIPSVEELLSIEGVAEITAHNFITHLPKFWNFVDENELNFLMKVKWNSASSRLM
jgi:hypothetical protein